MWVDSYANVCWKQTILSTANCNRLFSLVESRSKSYPYRRQIWIKHLADIIMDFLWHHANKSKATRHKRHEWTLVGPLASIHLSLWSAVLFVTWSYRAEQFNRNLVTSVTAFARIVWRRTKISRRITEDESSESNKQTNARKQKQEERQADRQTNKSKDRRMEETPVDRTTETERKVKLQRDG